MRVMKCIDHYLDTLHFWKDSSASDSEFDRLLRVLTSAGKSLRMASSDFQWASALRLFGNYSERIHASANKASDLFWLISLCTSLIHSYRRQHAMKHQINVLHSEYKGLQQASKLLRKRIAEQQEEKEKDTTINTSTSLSDEGLSDKTRTPIQLESSSAVTSLPDMKELEAQLLREEQQMHALKRQCYALRDQVVATILDMVREICDIPVPAFSLGLLHPSTTGMVGLSGTISSIIGLYQVCGENQQTLFDGPSNHQNTHTHTCNGLPVSPGLYYCFLLL